MLHFILKYPELVTNLNFIKFPTLPFYIQEGIRVYYDTDTEYGTYFIAAVESFRRLLNLDEYRLRTQNQLLILDYMNLSKIPVDNITQFGLRPPELRQHFNNLGDYYRWFVM